jgi:hypothetical protein
MAGDFELINSLKRSGWRENDPVRDLEMANHRVELTVNDCIPL